MSEAAEKETPRLRVQMNVLCVNGCGFYGTPQWQGRCSKCWRILMAEEKKNIDFVKNREAFRNFNNFEERRKLRATTPLNFLLKKSPSLGGTSGDTSGFSSSTSLGHLSTPPSSNAPAHPSSHSPRSRQHSPDTQHEIDDFKTFLKTNLSPNIAVFIHSNLQHLVDKIYDSNQGPEEISALVQAFYTSMGDMLNQNSYFQSPNCRVKPQDVLEAIEGYLCVRHYWRLFAAAWFSEEEVSDISLQAHIRKLNWVTSGALEMRVDLNNQAARDELDAAINEINDINGRRKVVDKLECLLRCSHRIFKALKESGAPTSADEFLPALIYVLLKGNPPQILSNINFIVRFGLPSRLDSGESAYFFVHTSGALQYVQNFNHTSLKMSQEEFEAYTRGELALPLNTKNCGCNQALSSLEFSLNKLNKLHEEQKELERKIHEFERRVDRWKKKRRKRWICARLLQREAQLEPAVMRNPQFNRTRLDTVIVNE